MSATAHFNLDILAARSTMVKPGAKKTVKTAFTRAKRRGAKTELVKELPSVLAADLSKASAEELELYADALILASHQDDEQLADDAESFALLEGAVGEEEPTPAVLMGSLPDWMLEQIEAAKGNAFDMLALFEVKSPSPKAAISMVDEPADEALYA